MPEETVNAIEWALQQTIELDGVSIPVTVDNAITLTTKVREYFNTNNISYTTFSYDDLKTFI